MNTRHIQIHNIQLHIIRTPSTQTKESIHPLIHSIQIRCTQCSQYPNSQNQNSQYPNTQYPNTQYPSSNRPNQGINSNVNQYYPNQGTASHVNLQYPNNNVHRPNTDSHSHVATGTHVTTQVTTTVIKNETTHVSDSHAHNTGSHQPSYPSQQSGNVYPSNPSQQQQGWVDQNSQYPNQRPNLPYPTTVPTRRPTLPYPVLMPTLPPSRPQQPGDLVLVFMRRDA